MDATALTAAGPAIMLHAGAAVLALLLGTLVLLMPKGTRIHKAMGRTWIGLMLVVALSSFLITEIGMIGPYSLIHALSVYTIFGVWQAVSAIRKGNVRAHRGHMIGLYSGALIVAGAFTLMPGRRMHAVLFADGGASAMYLALALAGVIVVIYGARRLMERRAALA